MKKFLWSALLVFFASSLQAAPLLVLQEQDAYSHFYGIVSNGGRWIVEGHEIFDGRTGLRWGEIPVTSNLSIACFTPDAKRILMSEKVTPPVEPDYWHVALCEMPSGRKLRWFDKAVDPLWCDNARFRGIASGAIVEFDFKFGRKKSVKIQDPPNEGNQPQYAFSENGKFLIEGASGVIRWWSTADGRLRGRIKAESGSDNATGISNDGKWLVSQFQDYDYLPEGIHSTLGQVPFYMYVWNATTRKVQHTFKAMGVAEFRFSSDGRSLWSKNLDLHRFNLRTGKDDHPFAGKDFPSVQILSQDWKWVVGISDELNTELWSLSGKKRVSRLPGPLLKIGAPKWSPDGKYLAGLIGGANLMLWDARTGKIVGRQPRIYNEFSWVDTKTIRSQTSGSMELWSVPDLKRKFQFVFSPTTAGQPSYFYNGGFSLSPDGRLLLTTDTSGVRQTDLWVWDVATKKLLRKIKIESADADYDKWNPDSFSHVYWLPDNRHVVFGIRSRLILLDTQTGNIEKEQREPAYSWYKGGKMALTPLGISPDGKWLAASAAFVTRDDKTVVFDLKNWSIDPAEGVAWWQSVEAARKPPGKLPPGGVASPNGKLMAYAGDLKGISIWSIAKGREVVRLHLVGGAAESITSDWIAITPEGYYDASPNGEKRLLWREGNNFWPITKSRARFKRPTIVSQALNPQ